MLQIPVTIAVGDTESDVIPIGAMASSSTARRSLVSALLLPSGVTAATFTVEGSLDGDTFYTIRDRDGAGMPITRTTGFVSLDPTEFSAFPYLRLVGDVAQATASATLMLIVREF